VGEKPTERGLPLKELNFLSNDLVKMFGLDQLVIFERHLKVKLLCEIQGSTGVYSAIVRNN